MKLLYREYREVAKKNYGFGKISSSNCLKQTPSGQKYLILQDHFQLDNSYAFSKAILYECQRS